MIDERVILKTNSQGYPILVRCGDQKIEVSISEDSAAGITDVEIVVDEAVTINKMNPMP